MTEPYAQTPYSPSLLTPPKLNDFKFGHTNTPSPNAFMRHKIRFTFEDGWMPVYECPKSVADDPLSQEAANALAAICHDYEDNYGNDQEDDDGHVSLEDAFNNHENLWVEPPELADELYALMDTNSQPGITTTMVTTTTTTEPMRLPDEDRILTPTRFLRDLKCHETLPPQPIPFPIIPLARPPVLQLPVTQLSPMKLLGMPTTQSPSIFEGRKPTSVFNTFARLANVFLIATFSKTDEPISDRMLKKKFNHFLEDYVTRNVVRATFLKPYRVQRVGIKDVKNFSSKKTNCLTYTIETFMALGLLECEMVLSKKSKVHTVETFKKTDKFKPMTKDLNF